MNRNHRPEKDRNPLHKAYPKNHASYEVEEVHDVVHDTAQFTGFHHADHDIGKNIVKVVMESYGYQVIDLGKDVPSERIVEAYLRFRPQMIGLSALMTTTVASMARTIERLKEIEGMCPILVGGAVLTADAAREIHADYYAGDALAAVEAVQKLIP